MHSQNVLFINIYYFQGTKVTDNVKEGADTGDITQMMTVKKDLSSMSDREKKKLLMKESPELFGLITDFKSNYFFSFFSKNSNNLHYICYGQSVYMGIVLQCPNNMYNAQFQ